MLAQNADSAVLARFPIRPATFARSAVESTIGGSLTLAPITSAMLSTFNSKFSFTPCRLHPASNGNSISESHPEYEGLAHHYVITITSSRGPNGGSSALPRPSSYTAPPRRTAPGPSNLCPSYLTTLVTIHSSYGCLVKRRKKRKNRCDELERCAATS